MGKASSITISSRSKTPRVLRNSLRDGLLTAANPNVYRAPPTPPPEWPNWRQERLVVAVRAALLFLQGKEWTEISRILEAERGLIKERSNKRGLIVTKSRIQQYVKRGCGFLVDRGCFVVPGTGGRAS